MAKKLLVLVVASLLFIGSYAQKITIKGIVIDKETNEPLYGANVLVKEGLGIVTDFDGKFNIPVEKGEYTITTSYVGFETIIKKITVADKPIYITFQMETVTLNEVQVVADVAKTRETPIAFVNVLPAKIDEQLASQDLPMILNSTPGVHATQLGGGDGDARITIRGFSQSNVAVMLDGIPVNDMENGWVYWSNWFGLDDVTRNIQVQRGLGASKLAIPSVGGTMNIITKGIDSKKGLSLKQEVGADGFARTTASGTTGRMKNGWGITAAGSYKQGSGYVDETWTKGYFYFLKIEKSIGKHIISLSGMGAPQEHAQRKYQLPISKYDKSYAQSLGVDTFPTLNNLGTTYNQHWGYIDRWTLNGTDTVHNRSKLNEVINTYHKPQYSLRDFWNVSDKLYVSNVAYLSIGNGGGTGTKNTLGSTDYDANGQIDWQRIYDANAKLYDGAIDPTFTYTKSGQYLKRQCNNHFWYGWLGSANYKWSNALTISGGLDLRSYKGEHYEEIVDLLGGDYAIDNLNVNRNAKTMLHVGDKVNYYNDGVVQWAGAFVQAEYRGGNYTTFINLSGAESRYQRIDYFAYTPDKQKSDWATVPSYTVKGGLNYNLNEQSNLFINLGYLSKSRGFKYIFKGYTNEILDNIKNEEVNALELGYSFGSPKFSANLNGYITKWKNKPRGSIKANVLDSLGNETVAYAEIPGMDALHMGLELDLIYKIMHNLDFEGMISCGDWRWNTRIKNVPYYNNQNTIVLYKDFDARGVHVGDAAQSQYAASLRYEPFKGFYINPKFTYFDRYFSNFDPLSLDGSPNAVDANGNPRDSWEIPAYGVVDLNTGYRFKLLKKVNTTIRFSILNVFDKIYIADARNNDSYNSPAFSDFDAKSASVYFGAGRRFNISLKFDI